MLIAALIVMWLFCGYVGWQEQMKRLGSFTATYDYAMIGPCMLMGPVFLLLVLSEPR